VKKRLFWDIVQSLDQSLSNLLTLSNRQKARLEIERDLSEYTGLPIEDVATKIRSDTAKACYEDWQRLNPKNHEQVMDFYKTTKGYLFDLARYDYFLQNRRERLPRLCKGRILDYGGGIGDMIIRCAYRGLTDLTYYDVEGKTMNFAKWRFARKGVTAQIISASDEEDRLRGKYDSIFCFDVLEHVMEPMKHAERLVNHLSKGGRIFIQVAKKSVHQPMHISSFDVEEYFSLKGLIRRFSLPFGMIEYYTFHGQKN